MPRWQLEWRHSQCRRPGTKCEHLPPFPTPQLILCGGYPAQRIVRRLLPAPINVDASEGEFTNDRLLPKKKHCPPSLFAVEDESKSAGHGRVEPILGMALPVVRSLTANQINGALRSR